MNIFVCIIIILLGIFFTSIPLMLEIKKDKEVNNGKTNIRKTNKKNN